MKKNIWLWVLALVLMIASAVYQRMTGPTHPVTEKTTINGQAYKFRLPRSNDSDGKGIIKLEVADKSINGKITLKRYKSHDVWSSSELRREGDYLIGDLPQQPAAGKVIYGISLFDKNMKEIKINPEFTVLRFTGAVPPYILYPHIIIMFLAMVFSMRAGLEAFAKGNKSYILSIITAILLTLGGMILGMFVQKYAFDAYWTGWPFGNDLTDNKTLVALVMWIIAAWRLKKNHLDYKWVIIASFVTLAVYLIPHSVLGSEIDYTKLPK